MAEIRVRAFPVHDQEARERSEADMAKWIEAGYRIVGTNLHEHMVMLMVTFQKD
ncbi:hypothetical protein [Dactylosporangium sp. CS-033363]|uniref:hypothetical protein n=1 Tax=Dactylosporangium sp. CS-033363 TaxID=3239935 RepID=UPI003D9077B5